MGSRWFSALLAAVACAAGLLWIWVLAFHTDWGAAADQRVFEAFGGLRSHESVVVALKVTSAGNAPGFTLAAAVLLVAAFVRGGWLLAAAVAAVLVGANVVTQALQPLTAVDRHPLYMPDASWPSGHTTGFAALAVCLVLVVPRRLRGVAEAAGVAMTALMGFSTLILGTHHPSDVLAAVLVAGLWAGLAAAVLWWHEGADGAVIEIRPVVRRLLPALAAVAILTAAVLSQDAGPVSVAVRDMPAALAGAVAVAALSLVVVSACSVVMDGRSPRGRPERRPRR